MFSAFLRTVPVFATEYGKEDVFRHRVMAYFEIYFKSNTKDKKDIFETPYYKLFEKKNKTQTYEEIEEEIKEFIKIV